MDIYSGNVGFDFQNVPDVFVRHVWEVSKVQRLLQVIGEVADFGLEFKQDFLFIFLSITIVGVLVGSLLGRRISGERLRGGFGWFLLTMGIYILSKELF